MSSNSFYYFGKLDYYQSIVLLIENVALKKGLKLRLLCSSSEIGQLDDILWTKKQLSFIPHAVEGDDLFATPVYISQKDGSEGDAFDHDVLMSLLPKVVDTRGKKCMYLVNNNSFSAFENLFNELKGRGQDCKFHVFENNKWHTHDHFIAAIC